MTVLSAHELAALVATLVAQPEALGQVITDHAYEDLLVDVGDVLARHLGGSFGEVVQPDRPHSGYGLHYLPPPPAGEGEEALDLPPRMLPLDAHRGIMANVLQSLAARVR